jgi:hypothetical protein
MSKDFDHDPEDVDALINELKQKNNQLKKYSDEVSLDKDKAEQFVLDSAAQLIKNSLDIINSMKPMLEAAPDHKEVSSFSELMNATSAAIDNLNKLVLQDKKSATIKEIKQMDIKAKSDALEDKRPGVLLSREEMFQKILDDAKVVSIEVESAAPLLSGANSV